MLITLAVDIGMDLSTSFIVLSIEEASNLSDDPNMTGCIKFVDKTKSCLG